MRPLPVVSETAVDDLPDRYVVAPGYGTIVVAVPRSFTAEGEVVRAGEVLARLEAAEGTADVSAPCDAWVLSFLVRDGERVGPGTPVAHLRAL